MSKVFLGGTCGKTNWREELIRFLEIEYFNPIVDDWNAEALARENLEKEEKCDIHFYCINNEMQGVFSIAEVINSVHNKEKITILQVMPYGFNESQLRSLRAVMDLVKSKGGIAIEENEFIQILDLLNDRYIKYL